MESLLVTDEVTFLDRGPPGAKTVLLYGRQVGYWFTDSNDLHFAPEHQDDEVIDFVKRVLEDRSGKPIGKVLNPLPEPPEWAGLDPDDDDDDLIDE